MNDLADPETTRYLQEVVRRLRAILGDELVGAYAGGSLALGGYDPGRSDVDVAVVCRGRLADEAKLEIVRALRHEALPCPARGLELVVYPESTVREATPDAGYELNLNTGRSMPFHLSLSPGDGEAEHWYGIDRAIVRDHGSSAVRAASAPALCGDAEGDAARPPDRVASLARERRRRPGGRCRPQRVSRIALRRGGDLVVEGGGR